jgi:hypothetical protein
VCPWPSYVMAAAAHGVEILLERIPEADGSYRLAKFEPPPSDFADAGMTDAALEQMARVYSWAQATAERRPGSCSTTMGCLARRPHGGYRQPDVAAFFAMSTSGRATMASVETRPTRRNGREVKVYDVRFRDPTDASGRRRSVRRATPIGSRPPSRPTSCEGSTSTTVTGRRLRSMPGPGQRPVRTAPRRPDASQA